jgi:hypothetical protein
MSLTVELLDELLDEERAAQGLPPIIANIDVLTRVANVLQRVDGELATELGIEEHPKRSRKRR